MRFIKWDILVATNKEYKYQEYVVLDRKGKDIFVERVDKNGKKSLLTTSQGHLRSKYRDKFYTIIKIDGTVYSNVVQEVKLSDLEKNNAIFEIGIVCLVFVVIGLFFYFNR